MNHSATPNEPRWFTIFDLLVIAFGCAAVWAWEDAGGSTSALSVVVASLVAAPAIVWLVIVFRQYRYRRPLLAAEYIIVFVTAMLIVEAMPNVDTTFDRASRYGFQRPVQNWNFWRWSLAGVITATVAGSATMDWRAFPRWMRTTNGTLLTVAFLWGPVAVFERHFDPLQFVPISSPISVFDVILLEIQEACCHFPRLMIALAAVAVNWDSFRRQRPTWRWTCWFGLLLAVVMTLLLGVAFAMNAWQRNGIWHLATVVHPLVIGILVYLTIELLMVLRVPWLMKRWGQPCVQQLTADRQNPIDEVGSAPKAAEKPGGDSGQTPDAPIRKHTTG